MLEPPEHQVAGHSAADGQLGPLVDGSGLFFKPLQSDDRGAAELAFYSSLSSHPSVPLRFFPSFHGTRLLPHPADPSSAPIPHLALEDLTADFTRPSVADFKIGSRTWAPSHPQPYFEKCLKKDRETTGLALGFRVSGLQILAPDGSYIKPNRKLVKHFTPADVRRTLREFVSVRDLDCKLAGEVYGGPGGVLAQLRELKAWFEEQTAFHFYSASVMVMHGEGKVKVKLVDFAHVLDGEGVIDHNFLGGLCSLIKFISDVVYQKEHVGMENGEM